MGLTRSSVGRGAVDSGLAVRREGPDTLVAALAGNPNVGKSTLFNALTGMNQHTGNWPGKTVSSARGYCRRGGRCYDLVDVPGAYSLLAHSPEEEVARGFVCFGGADAVAVVCDATCLERGLNLALQIMEVTPRVAVCVNLMDEAERKGIHIDLPLLSRRLGVPVAGVTATDKRSLPGLLRALDAAAGGAHQPCRVEYPPQLECAVSALAARLPDGALPARWLALRLLEGDESLLREADAHMGGALLADGEVRTLAEELRPAGSVEDMIVTALMATAEELCRGAVTYARSRRDRLDRRLDRLLTGPVTGYPVMLLLLGLVLWLTISGANYPSELLSAGLSRAEGYLSALLLVLDAPVWLREALVLGVWRTLSWVVAVMLPPMAIFFPLFTLLEDAGYLPRVAYNLDRPFQRCSACGKQALTMCMGLGCNAAGVTGCRIIDSPRERLLAIITNSFVPCNGRFPVLIAVIAMFFASGPLSALLLTGLLLLGIAATLGMTKLLSVTLLRGLPSSFTLELPPYRRPRIGRVIVRSLLDRTLFVLGRAAAVAAPAGLAIWLMANIPAGAGTLLTVCSGALDPLGRLLGLDGVILLAFILGFPANEIVLPIILMAYTAGGSLTELGGLDEIRPLLAANGWTARTAVCMLLFTLFHWPCSTTLLTIKKETGSLKWALISAAAPTLTGAVLCALAALLSGLG